MFTWQERAHALVQALPDFLTWDTAPDVAGPAQALYDDWVDRRLDTWSLAAGRPFSARVSALPSARRDRLRRAPRFFFLLRSKRTPGPDEQAVLERFLSVEDYLAGTGAAPPADAWSALGDFDGGSANGSTPSPHADPPPSPEARGIFVDTRSPHLQAYAAHPLLGPLERYEPAELPAVLTNLERGFVRVEQASPAALGMIRAAVSVIAAVKGESQVHHISSGSERRHIGVMSIANPHADDWTPEQLADSLVHEAIHSMIYRIELVEFFHNDDPASLVQQTTSPWSGRTLPLRTLVHACFVWFGLWHFWRLAADAGADCAELRERSRGGFTGRTLASLVTEEQLANIRPHVRATLERLFERVNATPA